MQNVTLNDIRKLSPKEQVKLLEWANDLMWKKHNCRKIKIAAERQKEELQADK